MAGQVALLLAWALGLLVVWRAPPAGRGTTASSGLPAPPSVTRGAVSGLWVPFVLAAVAGPTGLSLALTILDYRGPDAGA